MSTMSKKEFSNSTALPNSVTCKTEKSELVKWGVPPRGSHRGFEFQRVTKKQASPIVTKSSRRAMKTSLMCNAATRFLRIS